MRCEVEVTQRRVKARKYNSIVEDPGCPVFDVFIIHWLCLDSSSGISNNNNTTPRYLLASAWRFQCTHRALRACSTHRRTQYKCEASSCAFILKEMRARPASQPRALLVFAVGKSAFWPRPCTCSQNSVGHRSRTNKWTDQLISPWRAKKNTTTIETQMNLLLQSYYRGIEISSQIYQVSDVIRHTNCWICLWEIKLISSIWDGCILKLLARAVKV
jgi:hypothetical protein